MTVAADKRANLDLQVNLLAEHEVTKLATMLATVMEHLGIPAHQDREVEEISQDGAPEAGLDALVQDGEGHG